jgi:phospholipid/cholesterol/gamma-HCH transport system substrate-binding protein
MHISKEVKVGIIAIIVFALTIWGFNFLKGKDILKSTDSYFIIFDRADGLIEAGNVIYKGYKIGNISSLEFDAENSGKFIVEIALEHHLKIPTGSTVKIKQVNPLAATSDLEIVFSYANTYQQPGDTLLAGRNKGFTDILTDLQVKVESVLGGVDTLLTSINDVLSPKTRQELKGSIEDLHGSIASLNQSLATNGNLHNSFENLESVTANLKNKNATISSTLEHLSNVSSSLDSANLKLVLQRLDSTLNSTHEIIAKINDGQGTMGKLVNDSMLYNNLDSTSIYLNRLILDLNEHPKKYVHFSVFGKKEKQK